MLGSRLVGVGEAVATGIQPAPEPDGTEHEDPRPECQQDEETCRGLDVYFQGQCQAELGQYDCGCPGGEHGVTVFRQFFY